MIEAFQLLARTEGIIPALECAHALAWIVREAPQLQGQTVLMNLSGRGDKDVAQMMDILGADERGRSFGVMETEFRAKRAAGRKLLVPYITGGLPGWQDAVRAAAAAGADAIEIGIPFSDPVMDGPVIQQASQHGARSGRDAGVDPRRGARRSTSASRWP